MALIQLSKQVLAVGKHWRILYLWLIEPLKNKLLKKDRMVQVLLLFAQLGNCVYKVKSKRIDA